MNYILIGLMSFIIVLLIVNIILTLVKKNNIIPKIAATSKTVAVIIISPRFISQHLTNRFDYIFIIPYLYKNLKCGIIIL